MSRRPFEDDDLLCERCGYVLSGLRASDHCPECGRPVLESHPDARDGTVWQRRRAAWAGMLEILLQPGAAFSVAQAETEKSRSFKHLCLSAAGLSTAFVLVVLFFLHEAVFTGELRSHDQLVLVVLIANAGLFGMPLTLVLGLATAIEKRGIMTFGRLHHRRIDDRVAETIVGHASAAWMGVPALIGLGWVIGAGVGVVARQWRPATWELTLAAPYWMPLAGGFLGMLWFEWVVWIGVRRMRFANPDSASDRLGPDRGSGVPLQGP